MDTIKTKNIDGVKYITLDEHRQAMGELADAYLKVIDKKNIVIETLDNIITELEKWCIEESKYDESYSKEVVTFEHVLEKIKELKGE